MNHENGIEAIAIIDKRKKLSNTLKESVTNKLEEAQDTLKQTVKKVQEDRASRVYQGLDDLPKGIASNQVSEGCLVLEGGAFRGLYTSGVCDALMEEDLNFRTCIGISAGAMNGINYISGQIGRSATINLKYRNDSRYVGGQAFLNNKSVIGFDFVLGDVNEDYPIDILRFNAPNRRFVVGATNCETGEIEYFEKGICKDIFAAVSASASMPFVSGMVEIEGKQYLDGGCSCAIPYQWALDQNFEKIVLVRTRDDEFRYTLDTDHSTMIRARYHNYPNLAKKLEESDERYNKQCNEIEMLRRKKRIFVISPSKPIDIGRLERNTDRLGDIYYLGYNDAKNKMNALKDYLNKGEFDALSEL